MVDDSQIVEMGRLLGANLAFVSSITALDGNYFISGKIIDIQTARIEKQQTTETQRGARDLVIVVQNMVGEMIRQQPATIAVPATPPVTPVAPPVTPRPAQPTSQTATTATTHTRMLTGGDIELVYVEGSGLIAGFYIGKYEVTQAQWQAIMGDNPSSERKGYNRPVNNVSWDAVQTFIVKLNEATGRNYRLPTEFEWEFAARGGNKSRDFIYSGSNNIRDVGWYKKNCSRPQPVGGKLPNELGIHDMSGNVWEWCQDDNTNQRWFRGGSWVNKYGDTRVTSRRSNNANYRHPAVGFRLAHD